MKGRGAARLLRLLLPARSGVAKPAVYSHLTDLLANPSCRGCAVPDGVLPQKACLRVAHHVMPRVRPALAVAPRLARVGICAFQNGAYRSKDRTGGVGGCHNLRLDRCRLL